MKTFLNGSLTMDEYAIERMKMEVGGELARLILFVIALVALAIIFKR